MNPYEHLWKTLKVSLDGMSKLVPHLAEALKIVKDVMEEGEKMTFGDKGDELK